MQWRVFCASAAGKHHLDERMPCQDAGHHLTVGGVLIGVVCDGAGSAAHGQQGADFLAHEIPMLVAQGIASGRLCTPAAGDGPAAARAALLPVLGEARRRLADLAHARDHALRDFASTVVGCISARDGGCFFHIGDGFGICTSSDGMSVLSPPENGEYADQTYFLTDESWEEHVRVTTIPRVDRGCLIGLMTDGTSPFAVNRARTGFFGPFIDPVVGFLEQASPQEGALALQGLLDDEKTHAITADDKTLLLALAG
jgi:hypothetical protein